MAIDFRQVKAITIPEGTVKKIEDSNGNIIWGSQSAFPYRRLEYIEMEGKYWNSGSRPAKGFYYLDIKFNSPFPAINTSYGSYSIYLGCAGSSNRRLFFAGASNKVFQRLKTNSDTTMSDWNNLNTTAKYEFRLRTYNTNNTSGTFWFALQNLDTDSEVYGQYYNNSTYSMNLSELPYMHINAHAYNSSGTSGSPQTTSVKGALNFKLYRYFVREDGDTSAIKWDYYPVQRKSDGKVGLYNIKTGYFSTIKDIDGADVTTVTEPIADEYWDLTAPS